MVINTKELLDAVSVLVDNHHVKQTIKQSGKGALICGTCCFVGGVLAGPLGLAIGGTIGAVNAYNMSKDKFVPISQVIKYNMSNDEKQRLTQHIMKVAEDFKITDVAVLLPMLMSNQSIQVAVIKTVVSFVTNEMHMQILD